MSLPKGLCKLPARVPDTHKGDYGKVMVVAGSTGMAGAAVLCCHGAYRSGAGLVYLFTPAGIYGIVAAQMACTVVHPIPDGGKGILTSRAFEPIRSFSNDCDVAAIGPGLSRNKDTERLVHRLISRLKIPLILDADALNAAAADPDILAGPHAPAILTPHRAELGRLIRVPPETIKKDRVRHAVAAARKFRSIVVLKGHRTIVTDGRSVYENPTGNPGMATGGTGDVLTGIIAALVGQNLNLLDAARMGVYLHGLAGDIAAGKLGQISMMATDLAEALPQAFQTLS